MGGTGFPLNISLRISVFLVKFNLRFQATTLGLDLHIDVVGSYIYIIIQGFLEVIFAHPQISPPHIVPSLNVTKIVANVFFWVKWFPLLECKSTLIL